MARASPASSPALDALTDYPIRDRLSEIECPTLIVWGDEDRLVPVRDADEFGELIPNARKVVWPDTGHVAMLERPARSTRCSTSSWPRSGRARRRAGRGRRGLARGAQARVTAPSEALPTSSAYLASTPVRSAFGGGL